ncbi:MAG: radical SAM protein [Pseudomonadota bacterium]|nr:radical SAM protein [Pseudomonadota bacterium]
MNKGGALLKSGVGAARYRLTGHRMPLSVTLLVTTRCNALCTYCALPLRRQPELDTRQMIALVDDMAAAGCVRVGIGGGEPLVRDDIGAIVDRCTAHGIWTTLETNGYRYPALADELAGLGRLMISLDGGEAAHDANREPGAWTQAMAAIGEAARRGIDLHTITTLTRHNLDQVDVVLDLADTYGFVADFQVLQRRPFLSDGRATDLAPEDAALRKALRGLLEARIAGRRVGATEKYLRYLLAWKDYTKPTSKAPQEDLHCMAGQLYCAVLPDGTVTPCSLLAGGFVGRNVRDGGFLKAFEHLRDNPCRACTSTALTEYNYLYNLNAPTLLEWAKSLRSPTTPGTGAPRRGAA